MYGDTSGFLVLGGGGELLRDGELAVAQIDERGGAAAVAFARGEEVAARLAQALAELAHDRAQKRGVVRVLRGDAPSRERRFFVVFVGEGFF